MTIKTKPGASRHIPTAFSDAEGPDVSGVVAVVSESGDQLPLINVTLADLEQLADATRRAQARRLDYEDRLRQLRQGDAILAEIMADLEAANAAQAEALARVEAGLSPDDRMEGTSLVEVPGLIGVTFPAPRLVFKSKVTLREAYEDLLLRGAMGIYSEPTKPPALKIEVFS